MAEAASSARPDGQVNGQINAPNGTTTNEPKSAITDSDPQAPQTSQTSQQQGQQNGPTTNGPATNGTSTTGPKAAVPKSSPPSKSPQKFRSFGHPIRALTRKGPPGGFDDTPLPDAAQGFTVRFIFQYAVNLPPSDFNTASSDPFLTATLKGTNPKRHKEDPDLFLRTRTLRKTTSPEWQAEWVVCNVPPSGFTLKCRMYDEDYPDGNDRLGNVTIKIPQVYDGWLGIPPPGKEFEAKKRVISKRAFLMKGLTSVYNHNFHMTPRLCVSIEVLGKSDPPFAQMYTEGPTYWFKHFSPMIGRLAGTKVNADTDNDTAHPSQHDKSTKKYDFQANEMQLCGPVPSRLYHRYVEFKPIISSMFNSRGLRGKVLNAALHKQHARIYNFDKSTEYGTFEPCTTEASLQFLRLAHFDQGGRLFTYVLTMDGLLRFTETGHEFGIDLLSKHTMHSDVQTYIACSGEFFVRQAKKHHHEHEDEHHQPEVTQSTVPTTQDTQDAFPSQNDTQLTDDTQHTEPTQHTQLNNDTQPPPTSSHSQTPSQNANASSTHRPHPPPDPSNYQLIIDNDSGTYRPDKRILPDLQAFLERNFPGLNVKTMSCDDDHLQKLKERQLAIKKREGHMMNVVMNRSQSSISSAESDLDDRADTWEQGQQSKREAAYAALEDPAKVKDAVHRLVPGWNKQGESSKHESSKQEGSKHEGTSKQDAEAAA